MHSFGSKSAVGFIKKSYSSRLRVLGIAACSLICAAVRADADNLSVAEDIPTTISRTFPTTGTITAKQVGDGVWWQPVLDETSVTQVLTDLESWGVTNLYLDVFRSGHTLFPSEIFPQRAGAADRDWLAYITEEADRHNIRVHAWMQVLCWHDPESTDTELHPILSKRPEWLEVSEEGYAVDGKTKARFVSPDVPEVREALVGLVGELCRYPIDGLNLDAVEFNHVADTGYNAIAVRRFEEEYGVDPRELRMDNDADSDWMKWVTYRENSLTSVVELLSMRARESGELAGRRIAVSAVVHPGYEESRGINRRYQYWQKWLRSSLLDVSIPRCFNPELPELEQQLWEARSSHMGSEVACIPGLMVVASDDNSHPALNDQKRLLRSAGFQHCTVLDYNGYKYAMEHPDNAQSGNSGGFWGFFKSDE